MTTALRERLADAVGLGDDAEAGDAAEHGAQTVLGHSYGSLVVGQAADGHGGGPSGGVTGHVGNGGSSRLDADSIVFVGSPGVGAGSAAELRVPGGEVWATTARNDVIQWAAVSPVGLVHDVALALSLIHI